MRLPGTVTDSVASGPLNRLSSGAARHPVAVSAPCFRGFFRERLLMSASAGSTLPGRRDLLLLSSGLALLLAGAAADLRLQNQTADPATLQSAAARLDQLPQVIGLWTSTPGQIDERERRVAEIVGAVRRDYRHSQTGYTVTLTILSGASGPMSVHPPTACFEGVGYTLSSSPRAVTITDRSGNTVTLNRASFLQSDASFAETVRVFWGWSTDGQWDAPANPRLAWRGEPSLYKLYVVDRSFSGDHELPQAEAFLEDALPVIRQQLSGSAGNPGPLSRPN